MNPLFKRKYRYKVDQDISLVRSHIDDINKKRINEIAPNFSGEFSNDCFVFKPKLLYQPSLFGFPYNFCSITGKLEQSNGQTAIEVVIRPSNGVVIIFYLLVLLFIQSLSTVQVPLNGSGIEGVVGCLFLVLFWGSNIWVASQILVRRFEKLISVE